MNTAVSVRALRYLPTAPPRIITHVHELDVGLDYHLPVEDRDLIRSVTDRYVAASDAVRRAVETTFGPRPGSVAVIHEFVDTEDRGVSRRGG